MAPASNCGCPPLSLHRAAAWWRCGSPTASGTGASSTQVRPQCAVPAAVVSGNSQPECAGCLAGNVRLPAPNLRLASCQLRGRYGCSPPRGAQLSSAAPFLPASLSRSRAAAGLGPAPPGHLALAENHRPRAAGQPAGELNRVVTRAGSGDSLLRCCWRAVLAWLVQRPMRCFI